MFLWRASILPFEWINQLFHHEALGREAPTDVFTLHGRACLGPVGKEVPVAFTLLLKRQCEGSGGLLQPPGSTLGGAAGGRLGSLQWVEGLQCCQR